MAFELQSHFDLDSTGLDVSLSFPTVFKEGAIMQDLYAAGKVARINLIDQSVSDVGNDQAAAADGNDQTAVADAAIAASDQSDHVTSLEAIIDQSAGLNNGVKDDIDSKSNELVSDKNENINHTKDNKSVNLTKDSEPEKSKISRDSEPKDKQNSAEDNDPLQNGSLTNLVSFSGSDSVADRLNDAISETLNIENELMKEVNLVNKLASAKVDKNIYQLCYLSSNSLNKNDSRDKSASSLTKDFTPSDKDNTDKDIDPSDKMMQIPLLMLSLQALIPLREII